MLDDSDGLEGEVIVGAETALRTAPRYGWPPHDELLLYVVHGTLHLVGHDDRTPGLAGRNAEAGNGSIGETWNQAKVA